jgi:hypothetical protein
MNITILILKNINLIKTEISKKKGVKNRSIVIFKLRSKTFWSILERILLNLRRFYENNRERSKKEI